MATAADEPVGPKADACKGGVSPAEGSWDPAAPTADTLADELGAHAVKPSMPGCPNLQSLYLFSVGSTTAGGGFGGGVGGPFGAIGEGADALPGTCIKFSEFPSRHCGAFVFGAAAAAAAAATK